MCNFNEQIISTEICVTASKLYTFLKLRKKATFTENCSQRATCELSCVPECQGDKYSYKIVIF